MRSRERARPGRRMAGTGELRAQALARFGHALTRVAGAALAEIDADMAAPNRMLRLLQGDVAPAKRWWRRWPCCARWKAARRRR